ncbi:MAG: hypothetical protein V4473_01695 [Patescibacteria group bacterium]
MPKKIFTIFIYAFALIGFGLTAGYFAVRFGLTNTKGIVDKQRENFLSGEFATTSPEWSSLPEWTTLKEAVTKDKELIYRASVASGVPARLIVAQLVTEQLRFFFDDRESYKKFFEPLKILGSQTKFSWGVMGIKEDTAIQIEQNLRNKNSPFYLGPTYEQALEFKTSTSTDSIKQERFVRMTDQHAHYYSYLYAGLYLKQIVTQWKNAGFDISDRPEILSTLYNIGFKNSKPNPNPSSGGAQIPVGDKVYSFGTLAGDFYNSNELLDEFPKN